MIWPSISGVKDPLIILKVLLVVLELYFSSPSYDTIISLLPNGKSYAMKNTLPSSMSTFSSYSSPILILTLPVALNGTSTTIITSEPNSVSLTSILIGESALFITNAVFLVTASYLESPS